MTAVADASPLRYLVLIGEVEILRVLYEQILVPPAVVEELSQTQTPDVVCRWIANPPAWLRLRAPAGHLQSLPSTLGPGEREAIAVAHETKADVLLIDDGAGRREALRRRIAVQGTLGALGVAARRGVTDLRLAISRLRATNFRARQDARTKK